MKYPVKSTRVGRSFFVPVRRSKRAVQVAAISAHTTATRCGMQVTTEQVKGKGAWGVRVRRVA